MKRISHKDFAGRISSKLQDIEREEEHDEEKVEEAIENLRKHGGVDINLGDAFEVRSGDVGSLLFSPEGSEGLLIGEYTPSLKGDMYVIGRGVGDRSKELVCYKVVDSRVTERPCNVEVPENFPRFQLAVIPKGGRVAVFNLGGNRLGMKFEGEVEI